MTIRAALTDDKIASLKPAQPGCRYHVYDADDALPGFGVRVTERGPVSFILYARFTPGGPPSRSVLGQVGEMQLDRARRKAEHWLAAMRAGLDPRAEERQQREQARLAKLGAKRSRRDLSFRAAAEAYIRHKRAQKHRRVDADEREIARHLTGRWGDKLLSEIKQADVVEMVNELTGQGKRRSAHNVLGHARSLFNWAIDQGSWGVTASPSDRLKPVRLIGEKAFRQRVLSDEELSTLWRATSRVGYPAAGLYRLLLLTGCRLGEVAGVRWRELHPEMVRTIRDHQQRGEAVVWSRVPAEWKLWTVPAERFKSDSTHLVPLSDAACEVIERLPHFRRGDHVFSVRTFGEKPVGDFSELKSRVDRRMLRTMRALARLRGEDPRAVTLPRWVNHDIRRTVRTRLSSLKVPDAVAEMVVGHAKKGLQRTYDQHRYIDEMREALEAWAGLLRSIAEPRRAGNVVALPARRTEAAG